MQQECRQIKHSLQLSQPDRGLIKPMLPSIRRKIRSRIRRQVQRSRMLAATVQVVGELGYEKMSVARVTARAGVSRRTFYDLFVDRAHPSRPISQNP